MCFSASASFTAGAALLVAGGVTLKKTRHSAELAYAAIPLFFGVQQLIEGMVWLSFSSEEPMLNSVTTFVYSLFSHVLWPIYVPFAVLLLEPVRWRRRALVAFLAAGAAVGLYLLATMFRFPIESRPVGGHIEYASPHFYLMAVMGGYLAGTCISMLFSSQKLVNAFGAAALLSFGLAYAIYRQWFISAWCFFAAVLSVIVLLHFTNRGFPKESSHGMAV
ncbi:MAG: hypothetical protein K0R40_972 [Burkholderiales bacterium]|jgi:hypothetical protein|nr:hypothetical protein [Burkholderiales bacterium]